MEGSTVEEHTSHTLAMTGMFAALFIAYQLLNGIYAVYFHPLRCIPGPWYAAVFRFPYISHLVKGTTPGYLIALHAKYGPIVRYTPNEISVINGDEAWQEIYGFRTTKSKNIGTFLKDPVWYAPPMDGAPSIIMAGDQDHGRQRRILSHAFSATALQNEEDLLIGYANQLVSRLEEVVSASTGPVDMVLWYDFVAFDIISDLLFGEALGCLREGVINKHINSLFQNIKAFHSFYIMAYWPIVKRLGSLIINKSMLAGRDRFQEFVRKSVRTRVERDTLKHDFLTDILARREEAETNGQPSISMAEITSNVSTLLGAGTETTATTLAAATYLLLKNPNAYEKLKIEVRSRFTSDKEITIDAVSGLTYMLAVLNESLRIMPPVPAGFVRKVPPQGATVSGYYIPGNCNASISVSQYPSYHSPTNFTDPDAFHPSRWLDGTTDDDNDDDDDDNKTVDRRFATDNKATFQPFSYGPRACIGKNLAYAEMRLVLAKMVWHFDMALEPSCEEWMQGLRVLTLWEKPPLLVRLEVVERG